MSFLPSLSSPSIEVSGRVVEPCQIDPAGDAPIRGELFGHDDLETCAQLLARASASARAGRGRPLLARLRENRKILRQAHDLMAEAYLRREPLGIDAEWLIDNYHIVSDAVREVQIDLPRTYYRELPKLVSGPLKGFPRVYALALTVVAHTDATLDDATVTHFVQAFQGGTVLEVGELWAVPIMLRMALIENLRRLAAQMTQTARDRRDAEAWVKRMLAEDESNRSPAEVRDAPDRCKASSDAFVVHALSELRDHGAAAAPTVARLTGTGANPSADALARESRRQATNQLSVGNSVTSLRLIAALDWRVFFERTSLVEAVLRDDPAGVYPRQEFATCDGYRRAIEYLARGSGKPEIEVAREAIRAATGAAETEATTRGHVGYHLVGEGRDAFARMLHYRPSLKAQLVRWLQGNPTACYFSAIAVLTLLTAAGAGMTVGVAWFIPVFLLMLIPASELAVGMVHFLATMVVPPRVLPRFDFKDGIPADCTTFVVMPSMLVRPASATTLAERLEVHFLANSDPHLYFALLTDFGDAAQEHMPEDETYLRSAVAAIEALNMRHATNGPPRFFLFHRRRQWNASENCWMGWERKRGKLAEFNRLLRGAADTSFTTLSGDMKALPSVRYVITLDADTQLPREAARKLIATLAHPLNRARLDPSTGRVVSGYGILQPRISLRLSTASRSLFSWLFSHSAGIDPYVAAVSDVYQDLFGVGSFTGKGIYDVDAFESAVGHRFDENTILSHDLIEGNFARCGLVSDIELFDDFPAMFHAYSRREHRWVRGDWQLLPWLFRPGLDAVGAWKVFDNLRRSVVPIALVLLLALGWLVVPSGAGAVGAVAIAVLGLPLWLQLVGALVGIVRSRFRPSSLAELRADLPCTLGQVFLSAAFLADRAGSMVDAIARTLWRLAVSHRRMLEWETAASIERRLGDSLTGFFRTMWLAPVTAVALACAVMFANPPALVWAAPFLGLWLVSPVIAFWVSRPRGASVRAPLDEADRRFLRHVARKTWGFFETYIGDADHWLPPDNHQEDPKNATAHRTSPTNIGLLLLSTLAAYDLEYLTLEEMLDRLEKTLDTLGRLERHRGHFYNWYDTVNLQPLQPAYVSTVDSGNLLGCLLTLKQGLLEVARSRGQAPPTRDGLRDTFYVLEEMLGRIETDRSGLHLLDGMRQVRARLDEPGDGADWFAGLVAASGELVRQTEALVRDVADVTEEPRKWARRFHGLVHACRAACDRPAAAAKELADRAQALAERADTFTDMDFRFLYNDNLHLFSIGFNLPLNRLDNSHYDLLASEASLTSFLAIARGDAPPKHWFHLGRTVTRQAGHAVLISWGGTMFEYLMPRLFLRYFPNTLLNETCQGAVARQIEYGRQAGVPWGISESGFAALDGALDYQYRSFGVPGLGLKRGLGNDLVIAPYATALATLVNPRAAIDNFRALAREHGAGPCGFYEAIDYTRDRLMKNRRSLVVKSFMAHHQGMSLIALAGCLLDDPMPRRLRGEPMVRATELLLQERMPRSPSVPEPTSGENAAAARVPPATENHPLSRRLTSPHTPAPKTHLLSNGHYHVLVTNAGSGFSRFDAVDITRWREDVTRDDWGQFLYIRDLSNNDFWSAGFQPTAREPDEYDVIFAADKVDVHRRDGNLETLLEVAISPEHPAEIRRLTLTNHGRHGRDLEITSYAEVVLAPASTDAAHPAFGKLFLETEFLAMQEALLCRRRPRSPEQRPMFAVHVLASEAHFRGPMQYETDRAQFLGRGRTPRAPAALDPGAVLSAKTGPVLDPIFSLRRRVRIAAGQSIILSFTTAFAESREEALHLATRYRDPRAIVRTFELAWAHSQIEFRQQHVTSEDARVYQQLAGFLLYARSTLRAAPDVLAANRQGQRGLWRHGISGDFPIALLQVSEADQLPLAQQMLAAHTFWRSNGLQADLVILNEHPAGYFQELQEQLQNLVRSSAAAALADRPAGVRLLQASHVSVEDRVLLEATARVIVSGNRGSLAAHVDRRERFPDLPPRLAPRRRRAKRAHTPAYSAPEGLRFFNGWGGFTPDGREFVIFPAASPRPPADATPMPWINVIANPGFGFLVSEAGAGYTWAGNSQMNRLTPWNNDPVSDPPGEAIYLRDETSAEFWGLPALQRQAVEAGEEPAAAPRPWECRHGQGYTQFRLHHRGIAADVLMFVPIDAPIKIVRLRLRNDSDETRRLSATYFAEWVLGTTRSSAAMHVITEVDEHSGTLLARNAFNPDYSTAVAFVDVNLRPRTLSGDRTEFLGRNGSTAMPAALRRVGLSGRTGAGLDACAALQGKLSLPAGAEQDVVFVLGEASSAGAARDLAARFLDPVVVEQSLTEVRRRWDNVLAAVQVKTPDPAFDFMVNRWLVYQVLSCRVWARSAFYQSGGAYGFRDQLQDVMALVYGAPDEARAQILRAAGRQFIEGDVQHWWHPPSGKGVRTRFSDDLLWLPFVVGQYLQATGDRAILDEVVPYLQAPLLAADEHERYGQPEVSGESGSIYEHCARALEHSTKVGVHGLPLMGIGDWNDGMNRVGSGGKGESVWNAWFLLTILPRFAALAAERDDSIRRESFLATADKLKTAVEQHGWDGYWYRRAYFDDGTPLGSAANHECAIDSIVQTWAVISEAADPQRARQGMKALDEHLIRRAERMILLFSPPFDKGSLQPGYIKGYVPGTRENGGQYTHAATWAVQAAAMLGEGTRALEYFNLLNPINHAGTPQDVDTYKGEPYVVAADIYGHPPHVGRCGWTWYTGSAGWLYRVAIESILGFHLRGNLLRIDPCIAKAWKEYQMIYRFRTATYQITVRNPQGVERGVLRMEVDGETIVRNEFELRDDRGSHTVDVEMGNVAPHEAPR